MSYILKRYGYVCSLPYILLEKFSTILFALLLYLPNFVRLVLPHFTTGKGLLLHEKAKV